MPTSLKSDNSAGEGNLKSEGDLDLDLRLRDTETSRRDATLDPTVGDGHDSVAEGQVTDYKTYRRRWLGLVVLTLLNIIVSWDVSRRPLPAYLASRPRDVSIERQNMTCRRRRQSRKWGPASAAPPASLACPSRPSGRRRAA